MFDRSRAQRRNRGGDRSPRGCPSYQIRDSGSAHAAESPAQKTPKPPERYQLDKDYGFYSLVHDTFGKSHNYYVEWYEKGERQTRRRTLKTNDLVVATDTMSLIVRSGIEGDPKEILDAGTVVDIAGVLDEYEKSRGADLASAGQTHTAINHLKRHIGHIRVDAWKKSDFRQFEKEFLAEGYKKSYLSRICSVLRAALNAAEDDEIIARAPRIPEVCTDADKDAAPLRGRLMTTQEIAKLIDQAADLHFLEYLIGEINTGSRGVTILECDTHGIDWSYAIFELNPIGRVQTKKYRPIVRIPQTWKPWLEQAPLGPLISYNGEPVQSIKKAFRTARKNAGLKPDSDGVGVSTYSIRHSLGRFLEDCGVPLLERSILLGHTKIERKRSTERYSPTNCRGPLYLRKATRAIEKFVREINAFTEKWDLLIPHTTKPGYKHEPSPIAPPANFSESFEAKNFDEIGQASTADRGRSGEILPAATPDERS
jgi:hypothetical protein